jgi:fumarate hydratase subunit beta
MRKGSGGNDIVRVTAPLSPAAARALRAGQGVRLSGTVWAARDQAHARMDLLLRQGLELPFPIGGAVIYYLGPTPARPGRIIGSAGPTTSSRLDTYTPLLLEKGLRGMIGKGARSTAVREALVKHGAVYFAAVGGAAALLAGRIKEARAVAWEDLGPETLLELKVEDFPLTVANDSRGGDVFEEGRRKYRRAS